MLFYLKNLLSKITYVLSTDLKMSYLLKKKKKRMCDEKHEKTW